MAAGYTWGGEVVDMPAAEPTAEAFRMLEDKVLFLAKKLESVRRERDEFGGILRRYSKFGAGWYEMYERELKRLSA